MTRYALIDIGTNTIRLVIGERAKHGQAKFIFHDVIPTRLGENLGKTGTLSQQGIDRTIEALQRAQAVASSFQPQLTEAYATAWARAASNTDEMLSRLADINLPVWILTGEEEALLGFEAVKMMYPKIFPSWILDIGGGSCEVTEVREGKPFRMRSLPMGAVNFTERFLNQDPPIEQLEHSRIEAQRLFEKFCTSGENRVAVIGGTGAALGALKVKVHPSNPVFFNKAQGLFLRKNWIAETLEAIASVPLDQRQLVPGMERERADILVGGTVLLLDFLTIVKANGAWLCLYSFVHALLHKRLTGDVFLPSK